MPIEVEAPDGSVAEFPDGTDQETIKAAMQKRFAPDPLSTYEETTGLGRQLLQGASLGFGDEVLAAIRAPFTEETYGEELEHERGAMERYEQQRPNVALGAEIAGGFALPGGAASQFIRRGGNLLGRTARSSGVGSAYGGAYGYGTGEEGTSERLESAGEGAVSGAVIGGAVPPALSAGRAGAQRVAEGARNVAGRVSSRANTVPEDYLIRTLERSGMTPGQARQAWERNQAATRFGANSEARLPETIADIGGRTTQRAGYGVASQASGASRIAERSLETRQRGQFSRLNDLTRRALNVKSKDFGRTVNRLTDEQRKLATPAYQQAFDQAPPINIGTTLLDWGMRATRMAGSRRDALEKAIGEFRNKFTRGGRSARNRREALVTLRQIDDAKKAVDDQIDAAKRAGRSNEVRLLTEFKNDILNVADEATTVQTQKGPQSLYAKARNIYSSRAESLDALESGRQFLRGDGEMTVQAFRALPRGEKTMFRIGVARELQKKLGDKKFGDDMTQIFRRPNVREVLDEMFPRRSANINRRAQFNRLVDAEERMSGTRNRVLAGSETAERLASQADFSRMSAFGRFIQRSGGIGTAAMEAVGQGIQQLTRMREADAVMVARMMFSTNPGRIRRTFDRLEQRYGEQTARQVLDFANRFIGSYMTGGVIAEGQGRAAQP